MRSIIFWSLMYSKYGISGYQWKGGHAHIHSFMQMYEKMNELGEGEGLDVCKPF